MKQSQIPTDVLYRQGIPMDGSRLVSGIKLDSATSPTLQKDIDWDQPVVSDEETAYATASASSHYHYQNVSHVLLCDKILVDAQDVPEPVRKAAERIVAQCAKDVTAWGKYLHQQGGGGNIPKEQREYYQMLFSEDEVLPVLLGIQTKNIAADKSRIDFYKNGDPLFHKLANGTAEENRQNFDPLTTAFRNAIQPLSIDERERLLRKVAQQVDLLQIFCMKRDGDIYKPLNSDANRFLIQTGKQLKRFYDDIGLTDNIF